MINLYVIGDTHFYHEKIIEYCNRPFKTVEQMNMGMIKRWNSTVRPEDRVIHLGDFGFTKGEYAEQVGLLVNRLNGYKILIKGNHDRKSSGWYMDKGFSLVVNELVIGNIMFTHRPKLEMAYKTNRINVHGHTHKLEEDKMGRSACVEVVNYTPILVSKLVNKRRKV